MPPSPTPARCLVCSIDALGAGILLFVAGVLQKMMDDVDPPAFKRFLNALGRAAMTSPFAVTIATLPIIAAVAYFIAYGFDRAWFIAGFVAWIIGSSITKIGNMPVYAWAAKPENDDPEELSKRRRIVLALAGLVTVPLLWLARKYIPH